MKSCCSLLGFHTDSLIHLEEAEILYSLLRDCVSRPRELGRRGSVSSSLSLRSFSFWHITCWLRRVPPSCGHCVRSPPPCSDAGCACIVAILGCSLLPRVVCGVAPSATEPPWLACAGRPDPSIHRAKRLSRNHQESRVHLLAFRSHFGTIQGVIQPCCSLFCHGPQAPQETTCSRTKADKRAFDIGFVTAFF